MPPISHTAYVAHLCLHSSIWALKIEGKDHMIFLFGQKRVRKYIKICCACKRMDQDYAIEACIGHAGAPQTPQILLLKYSYVNTTVAPDNITSEPKKLYKNGIIFCSNKK